MATQLLGLIQPGTPSGRVLLRGHVGRTLVGRRPVDPRLVGPRPVDRRLVDRSPCSLLLRRVHQAVTCSGETGGGGGEEGAVRVTLPPLPRPRAPPPLFFLPRPLLGTAVDEEGPGGMAILSSNARRRGASGMEDLPPRADEEGASERSGPAPTIFQHLP